LIVLISLGFGAQACGMFTPLASDSPAPAAALSTAAATPESVPPTVAPTTISQTTEIAPAADALPTLVPVLDANGDGQIDICEAIPQSVLEETLGRKLTGPGAPFTDAALGDGCAFDFGKDSSEAYFAYVTLATEKQFTDALANAVKAEPVTTIGDSAFLNYGPDARQLWVRAGKKAVLVAIGDRENVAAEMIFARYLVDFASAPAEITAESFAGKWQNVDSNSNNPRQYCQVDITAQGNMLTMKFASVCNPLTYIDFLTTTVAYEGNPVVIKVKDVMGGEFTITLLLNGDKLNVTTVYVDKDGNPGINITDEFSK
jgi:hypothetical protein